MSKGIDVTAGGCWWIGTMTGRLDVRWMFDRGCCVVVGAAVVVVVVVVLVVGAAVLLVVVVLGGVVMSTLWMSP